MSSLGLVLLGALAVIVGALIPIQAATNAAMSRVIGSVAITSLALFAIGGHMKPIEEILRVGVAIEVDVMKRVTIARQELLDAQRAGAIPLANQHDVTITAGDQLDAAEDERPHEDLAQLGIRLDKSEQLFTGELDHLARRDGPNPRQSSATRQHGALRR